MYNLMVGLFDHKIRTQSHFVILTVWVNFSQHLRPRFPGQTTFGPRRPGSTRSQVWGLLQQMCPSSAICPVKVSLSRRPEPYLCALSKRFGPKYQPNVVKRYWLDSSCSLLLSSRPVCFFFYPAIDKVGRKHWADVSAGFLTGFSFFYLRVWIFSRKLPGGWPHSDLASVPQRHYQSSNRVLERPACVLSPEKTTKQNKTAQSRGKNPRTHCPVLSAKQSGKQTGRIIQDAGQSGFEPQAARGK